MPTDDELLDLLSETLRGPTDGPSADRVASLRSAVAAASANGSTDPADTAGAAPATSHPEPVGGSRRSWLRVVPLGLAAAAAVAVAFFIGRATVDDGPSAANGVVEFDGALTGPGSGDGRATVRVERTGIGRVVTFDTSDLPILPIGDYYELWFVGPDDEPSDPQRVSAGTFHPDEDGRSQVTFAAAVDPARFSAISVTAEPSDGDPGPSGEEVLRAELPG